MKEIELVIKISEDSYKTTCNGWMLPTDVEDVVRGIKNGTVLPKGHGRLIDESKIAVIIETEDGDDFITDAPTIIEADKEGE